jgi:soluble lytic murein transglycosylase-like protein
MMAESGGDPNAVSSAGAQGLFQLMPATQKQFNVTNWRDPTQQANAAAMYMQQLLAKYQGNYAEALAAYNWGPGNEDKDIAKYGNKWMMHAPKETQGYVQNIAQRLGVTVTVINQTGAQTAILANSIVQ